QVPDVIRRQDRVADLLVVQDALGRGDEAEGSEVAVLLLRQVVADGDPVREPRRRGVRHRAAGDESLDAGRDRLVEQRVDHPRVARVAIVSISPKHVEYTTVGVYTRRG